MKRFLVSLVISGFIFVSTQLTVQAVPSFARKYQTSCMTCHNAFPKLNSFGEVFRRRGYRMPNDKDKVKEEEVQLGAPAWRTVWPKGIWPGAIPNNTPVGFVIPFSVNLPRDEGPTKLDFAFPEGLSMLLGGTLGDSLSFYGDIALVEGREFGGINSLFGHFKLMRNNLFNVRIGQFGIAAVPFPGHTSLFLSDSLFNSFSIKPQAEHHEEHEEENHNNDNHNSEHNGEDGHNGNHDEQKDNFLASGHHSKGGLGSSQIGIEIEGFMENLLLGGGFGYTLGVVNGNGSGSGHNSFDNNTYKDFYFRTFYKIGGMGLLGGNTKAETGSSANYFDISPSLQFGVFGTWGRNPIQYETNELEDRSRRIGFDLSFKSRFVEISGAFMKGRSEFMGHGVEPFIEYSSQFVEVDLITFSWVIPAFRYDRVDIRDGKTVDRFTPNVTFLIRANVKLVLENQWVRGIDKANSAKVTLVFAF